MVVRYCAKVKRIMNGKKAKWFGIDRGNRQGRDIGEGYNRVGQN